MPCGGPWSAGGIVAPLMVVRGDGTLMSDEFAARTPVETIHSGPGRQRHRRALPLRASTTALVVDVGGTTTDLALIEDGQVTVSVEGADGRRVQDLRAGRQPAVHRAGRRQPHHGYARRADRGRAGARAAALPPGRRSSRRGQAAAGPGAAAVVAGDAGLARILVSPARTAAELPGGRQQQEEALDRRCCATVRSPCPRS